MRYVFSAADTVRYRFPTHTGQIFFLQQGYGTLEVGTGDVVRIPAHTPHRIYCGSDTPPDLPQRRLPCGWPARRRADLG